MEAQEGQLELGDDQVLVVAGVADQGSVLAVAGQIQPGRAVDRYRRRPGDLLGQQRGLAPVHGAVVQLWRGDRPAPIDAVEVQGGDAEVPDGLGVLPPGQAGGWIKGHVVVQELAQEGEASRDRRVVGVVGALGRVGDQGEPHA